MVYIRLTSLGIGATLFIYSLTMPFTPARFVVAGLSGTALSIAGTTISKPSPRDEYISSMTPEERWDRLMIEQEDAYEEELAAFDRRLNS